MFDLPEEKFIINAIKYCNDKEKLREELKILCKNGIEWNLVPAFPFLYFKTKEIYKQIGIPEEIFENWKNRYFLCMKYNEIILKQIKELANEFRKENIDLIFLKGAAEIISVYKANPGLRGMGDIDVLIKLPDFNKTEEIMHRLGYVHAPINRKDHFIKHKAILYEKNKSFGIDLQWKLFAGQGQDAWMGQKVIDDLYDYCFENKREILVDNITVFVADVNTHIIYLIFHAVKRQHLFYRHIWNWGKPFTGPRIKKISLAENLRLLSQVYLFKEALKYFGKEIDWVRINDFIKKLNDPTRVRLFLSTSRLCDVKEIPGQFYTALEVPKEIDDAFLGKLVKKIDRRILIEASSVFYHERTINTFVEFLAYLIMHFFGLGVLNHLRIVKNEIANQALHMRQYISGIGKVDLSKDKITLTKKNL